MSNTTNKDRDLMKPFQKERIQTALAKKCKQLNKRYPANKYEVKDNKVVRLSGVRPHKRSKKAPKG